MSGLFRTAVWHNEHAVMVAILSDQSTVYSVFMHLSVSPRLAWNVTKVMAKIEPATRYNARPNGRSKINESS